MKTLSISVAAYNMEKLIRQNLDSFVHSPVCADVEVLVINDGSKDSTAQIVQEYAEKYPDTVKLINQPNAGPGSTVNRGMEHATGKYFRMVDADDWVGDGFAGYVNVLKNIDVDMVLTNYTMVDDKTGEQRLCKVNGIAPGRVFDFADVCENLFLEMHSTTFRTELLQQNQIHLFNGFYTDLQYLLFPAPYVQTIYYADCNVYMYRVSLSGQSMSAPSMQRNIAMHEAVLFSLTDLYEKLKTQNPRVAGYVCRKAVMMAGTQMGTLLSFAPSKARKADLFAFFEKLQQACPDVYARFKTFKTARVLRLCGGVLYTPVSRMHRKKIGLVASNG